MLRLFAIATGTVALGLSGLYAIHLGTTNGRVLGEFEALAANSYYHVVAEPLHVRGGLDVRATGVAGRLARAGLRHVWHAPSVGEYQITPEAIVYRRADRNEETVTLELSGNVISALLVDGEYVNAVDLPPEHLTSFRSSLHERRAPVAYQDLPQSLLTAVLAAEDRRFFEHGGLDWRGIARAFFRDVTHGRVVEGGSTITQQTVKIILHRTRRELPAKVDEAMLAILVERRFTKQQILTVYLNNVYLGHEGPFDVHGVAEGARFFFGKPLVDLTDKQMYELAATIRAPNAASPRRHSERLEDYTRAIAKAAPGVRTRGDTEPSGLADSEAGPLALESTASTADRLDFETAQLAYYFDALDREWDELRRRYRIEPPATLVASVDPVLQLRAAQALRRGLAAAAKRKTQPKGSSPLEGAVVALDPVTGELRAVVGGSDYVRAPFNRAINMSRQVGSTFKPFVYLTAFAAGDDAGTQITQASPLPDELHEYQVGTQTWAPANSDGQFRGEVTARLALEQSINTATVALGMSVGVDRVAAMAQALGIAEDVPKNPSMLLGAVETSPLRLAGAYACFANGGLRVTPHALKEVQIGGRVLRPERPGPRRVASASGTYLVTDMLEGVLKNGTGASAGRLGFQHTAAGKTGTSDQARDTWFVGYTPELVTSVWVGHDDNAPTGLSGASAALPVWVGTMGAWLGGGVDAQFDVPSGIVFRSIDPLTGGMSNSTCPDVEMAAFLDGTEPQGYCTLHSATFGERWDRAFGDDGTQPDDGVSPPPKRSLWNRLRSALGG